MYGRATWKRGANDYTDLERGKQERATTTNGGDEKKGTPPKYREQI